MDQAGRCLLAPFMQPLLRIQVAPCCCTNSQSSLWDSHSPPGSSVSALRCSWGCTVNIRYTGCRGTSAPPSSLTLVTKVWCLTLVVRHHTEVRTFKPILPEAPPAWLWAHQWPALALLELAGSSTGQPQPLLTEAAPLWHSGASSWAPTRTTTLKCCNTCNENN